MCNLQSRYFGYRNLNLPQVQELDLQKMQPLKIWLPILSENISWSDQPANSKQISVEVTNQGSILQIITSWFLLPTKQESSSCNSIHKKDWYFPARTSFNRCVRLSFCDATIVTDHSIDYIRIQSRIWSSDLYIDWIFKRPLLLNL